MAGLVELVTPGNHALASQKIAADTLTASRRLLAMRQ